MKLAIATLALASALSTAAAGEFISGNTLLADCRSTSAVARMDCLGYVTGVHDALYGVTICSPQGVTRGQLRDVVVQALASRPEALHRSADRLVGAALAAAWPCEQLPQPPPRLSF